MYKILISDKLAQEGVEIFRNDRRFQVDFKPEVSAGELLSIIGRYDALIIRSRTKVTAEIINKAKKLKVIGRAGVGVDNVDIPAATVRGVVVMNAPSGNTISACEQAFALMLSLARNIPQADKSLREGKWERNKFKGTELYNKTLGIVGLGRIGREVVKRALAFGMKVICYDPFINEEAAKGLGVFLGDLKYLLKNADFITIHTPLNEETKDMINASTLRLMKPNCRIINCARGGIVNEKDLAEALAKNKIAGAGLDVFEKEPPDKNSLLFSLPNVVVTPHLGASTKEAQVNVAIEIAHCVKDALLDKGLRNTINFPSLDPETYKVVAPYINLAEKMGLFVAQVAGGGISSVLVTYKGEINRYNISPITSAVVKGLLKPVLEGEVNFINAVSLIKDRGVAVESVKSSEESDYVSSLILEVKTSKQSFVLEGTLFANQHPRIVRINNTYLEINPEGNMLFIINKDRPGVIGKLGGILGRNKINIGDVSLGRHKKGREAFTILTIDSSLPEKVIKKISSDEDFILIKPIALG